ncbi:MULTISPECIES: hypothetical protein [Shewanella]|nr:MULTISPECIES: hypothetical protein [Shewanella]
MSSHQEIIGKGMLRFIVLRGVLGWGVTTAFIVQIIMSLTSDKSFFDGFITSLIAFPLGGILYGYVTWMMMLNKSRQLK